MEGLSSRPPGGMEVHSQSARVSQSSQRKRTTVLTVPVQGAGRAPYLCACILFTGNHSVPGRITLKDRTTMVTNYGRK